MARTIAICNHKGGVGKTTSVINIGAGLSRLKQKVLLIDLDPQANLSQSYGIEDAEYTVYDVMQKNNNIKPVSVGKKIFLIPASVKISSLEVEISNEPGREFILKEAIEKIKGDYDFIIIDCPPSLGLLTMNALTACREVYIPLQSQYLAIHGLNKLLHTIEKIKERLNKDVDIKGIIITQYDKRKVLCRDIKKTIEGRFGEKVCKSIIRDNVSLAEAPVSNTDIFNYSGKSYGAQDYMALAREILNKADKITA